METTIMGYIRVILGLYWDNGKDNGNHNVHLAFHCHGMSKIAAAHCQDFHHRPEVEVMADATGEAANGTSL